MNWLERMIQYKDKSKTAGGGADSIGDGLFTYPILTAADILLYQADRGYRWGWIRGSTSS
jgi:tryptophanyl-tRNA synthetase